MLGTAIASAAGQHVGQLGVVEPSRPRDPLGHAAGGGAVAVGIVERVEERRQVGQLVAVLAAQGAGGLEVAALEVAREPLEPRPERAEADDQQPGPRLAREHQRPRGQQQLDALGGDQLADEDHEPVAGLDRGQRRRRLAGRARERVAALGRPATPRASSAAAASRARSRSSPARASSGSRGVKRSTSTPGGPRRVRSCTDGSSISAHRLAPVW